MLLRHTFHYSSIFDHVKSKVYTQLLIIDVKLSVTFSLKNAHVDLTESTFKTEIALHCFLLTFSLISPSLITINAATF